MKALVDINNDWIKKESQLVLRLKEDINRFKKLSLEFNPNPPKDLFKIWDEMNIRLEKDFGGKVVIKAEKIAFLTDREQQYKTLSKLWKSIKLSPVLKQYKEFLIIQNNGSFAFATELDNLVHEKACTYLEGKKEVELYHKINAWFDEFEEIEKLSQRGGEKSMSNRTLLERASHLFRIDTSFRLYPDTTTIKEVCSV